MVVVHVLKVNSVQKLPLKHAKNALLVFFKRKTKFPVHFVKNARRGGINHQITRPVVRILVASNPKIAAMTSIGYPTNFLTGVKNPGQVVCLARMVGPAVVPLARRAFTPCSGGPSVQV